jgi:predicted permease
MLHDIRFAFRLLLKNPGFTFVAVLSLALGIGVNTSVFTFINAILLRPLPAPHPEQLVSIYHQSAQVGLSSSSWPDYEYYRDHNDVFSGLMAFLRVPMILRAGDTADKIRGELISGNYFSVLGIRPLLGRAIAEDQVRAAGSSAVAVLSYGLWQRRFGSDPGILGKNIAIAGFPFTVIGVAPREFHGVVFDWGGWPDIWIPATMYREAVPALANFDVLRSWGMHSFLVVGRLRQGITLERAQAALSVLSSQAAPNRELAFERQWQFSATLFATQQGRFWPGHRASVRRFLALLATAVALVLLIACLNIANLLLARGFKRQREIAIRLALGASRWRIIRQLVIEGLILSALGGAAGLFLAVWITRLFGNFPRAFRVPLALETGMDIRVFGFAFLISVIAGLLFSLLPARQTSSPDLTSSLKTEIAGSGPNHRSVTLRDILVVAQVALSLVLLIGAGLLVRTLRNAEAEDVMPEPGNVLLANLELVSWGYDEARSKLFYPQLLERVSALQGVKGAALVSTLPLSGMRGGTDIVVDDRPPEQVDLNIISPDYFKIAGLPVLRGREFKEHDREASPLVAVINEKAAERFWPHQDPLGKRFRLAGNRAASAEVVGVVKDGKFRNLREPLRTCLYLPLYQHPRMDMNLEVRTAGDPLQYVAAIRNMVRELDRELPLSGIATWKSHRDASLGQERLAAAMLICIGGLALVLAAVGIYGVMSFSVEQRTREIGVRVALGAQGGDVLRLVLRHAIVMVLIGLGIGLVVALALTRLIAGLLYELHPADPPTYSAIAFLLIIAALTAAYFPARRATKVDPLVALRHE